jgi:hypothetical protein
MLRKPGSLEPVYPLTVARDGESVTGLFSRADAALYDDEARAFLAQLTREHA